MAAAGPAPKSAGSVKTVDNTWGSPSLYLATNCLPKEEFPLSPPVYDPEGERSDGKTTIASQQRAVREKFEAKISAERKVYPYKYVWTVPDSEFSPRLMRENPQIGLAPDRAAAVVRGIRRGAFSSALATLTHFERLHHDQMPPPPPPPPAASADGTKPPAPVLPPGCYNSGLVHCGPLTDTTTTAFDGSGRTSPLPPISPLMMWFHKHIPWGFFQRDAVLTGAERWTVIRCDQGPKVYRVNFYRMTDGNSFYNRVLPTDWSGVWDYIKLKWKGTI